VIDFTDDARFVARVAAACLLQGHVLAQKADDEDFWSLPGGRIELMESSDEALARELREELGVGPPIGRLLWVVENLFHYAGRDVHEIGFYYLVSLDLYPDLCQLDRSLPCGDGPHLMFRWLPLEELESLHLLPEFLQRRLSDLPSAPKHLVNREIPIVRVD
jgi:8-oxo-dGTP pyrophosphatase MutT (NUDIX family)